MNPSRKPPYTPDDPEYDHPPPKWAVEAGARLAAMPGIIPAEEPDYRPELAALASARAEARNPAYKAMMDECRLNASRAECSRLLPPKR
jgi:hypothetical protein